MSCVRSRSASISHQARLSAPFFLGVRRITRPVSVVIRQGDDAILDESEKCLVYNVVRIIRLIPNCEASCDANESILAPCRTLGGSMKDFIGGVVGRRRRGPCTHPPSEPDPFWTWNDGDMNAFTPT